MSVNQQQELNTLDSYLYSNLLIIRSNQAASRVTRKTWSGIESRMLLPVAESIQSTDEQ
ncbi:MAG: hypothetical protein AAGE84_08875 [Cyanobacteria bacterium P01_G01_bin.39]